MTLWVIIIIQNKMPVILDPATLSPPSGNVVPTFKLSTQLNWQAVFQKINPAIATVRELLNMRVKNYIALLYACTPS